MALRLLSLGVLFLVVTVGLAACIVVPAGYGPKVYAPPPPPPVYAPPPHCHWTWGGRWICR
jgi:hypothetical protein